MSRITLCGSLSRWASPLGAAMHNAAYRASGLPWHYVPFELASPPDEPTTSVLAQALAAMRTLGIRGFGISATFKTDIIALLDDVDEDAKRIGAVNTVVNDEGRLTGYNTDAHGAVTALEERRPLAEARVLLLGAGGAARAVAHGVAARGSRLLISNRSPDKAETIARDVGAEVVAWNERHEASFDMLINATTLGMTDVDSTSPFPLEHIPSASTVMDIVYKPLETQLVAGARSRGATVIDGSRMLLHQACRQHELYTGAPAPVSAMHEAITSLLG